MVDLPKTESADFFAELANELLDEYADVKIGEMIQNPSMKLKGRNFAVFMVELDKPAFRLGKDFDVTSLGITNVELLNPSKERPPMEDWFVVDYADKDKWVAVFTKAFDILCDDVYD